MMAYVPLAFMLFVVVTMLFIATQNQSEVAYAFASATKDHLRGISEKAEKLKNVVFSVWDKDEKGDAFNADPLGFHSGFGNHPGKPYNSGGSGANSPLSPKSERPYRYAGDPNDPLEQGQDGTGTYSHPFGNGHTPASYYQGHYSAFIPGISQDDAGEHAPKCLDTGEFAEGAFRAYLSRPHASNTKKSGPLGRMLSKITWFFK
ncbi:hypothetical protein IJ847_00180 [Candidatus Saccharibacteria bacterium]|nr:hypothetical protein [Candidatus Saccharibacteria bacterium]